MKRDAALAALNSNYRDRYRARCLLMSLEVLWGLGTSHKGQCGRGWWVMENRLKPLHNIKMGRWTSHSSNRWIHTSCPTFAPFFFLGLEISAIYIQKGGRGEREWQGPLLRRVDYLMKGNQLERYGGLWTFIHLVWPLLNFHDGLWLFRGRDQS